MKKPTEDELRRLTEALEAIASDSLLLAQLSEEEQIRLKTAAGRLIYPDKLEIKLRNRAQRRLQKHTRQKKDRSVRAATEIRTTRKESVFIPPPSRLLGQGETTEARNDVAGILQKPRNCYICKELFSDLHFFYDSMCLPCARFNYAKRIQTARLDGQVAIITGARLKIGYQAALMMLRAGARVIVTTRFPKDAALRYAREADFETWKDRLQIYGLDLRHSPSVETFCHHLNQTIGRLDILINNAAQTVRRPPEFYAHMMETETAAKLHEAARGLLGGPTPNVVPALEIIASANLLPNRSPLFPEGRLDADLQQVDLRDFNSWRMTLAEVPTAEMIEVQLVNSVAPFILCSKLKPLMMRDPTGPKHIVNVSAMEGKFSRHTKTDKHPHTNMAKAALNMMTLTSARDYAKSGIYMNAVDTGWVTDEDPAAISARKQEEHDFQPPLDIVDGAARVCDPFFSGILSNNHSWGNFFKDYLPTAW